eukprot:1088939-Pyramimonas_sp.AAC.1
MTEGTMTSHMEGHEQGFRLIIRPRDDVNTTRYAQRVVPRATCRPHVSSNSYHASTTWHACDMARVKRRRLHQANTN